LKRVLKWILDLLRGDDVPKVSRLLFIEPEQHYLEYGSCVMRSIVAEHAKPEYTITEVRGSNANPDSIDKAISPLDPKFIFFLGHGAPCAYTVECTELYMSVMSGSHGSCDKDRRLDLMSGRVIHANSCLVGQELGPALIAHGAKAFIGSNDTFWLYIGDPPCSSRATQSAFLAEYQVEATLMEGLSMEQAWRDSQTRYDAEIAYWTVGEGKDHRDAASIARILQMNKSIQILLGEGTAIASSPLLPPGWSVASLALGMIPLIGVGAVISSEELTKLRWWEWFR